MRTAATSQRSALQATFQTIFFSSSLHDAFFGVLSIDGNNLYDPTFREL
jgi:hypothetical protein